MKTQEQTKIKQKLKQNNPPKTNQHKKQTKIKQHKKQTKIKTTHKKQNENNTITQKIKI